MRSPSPKRARVFWASKPDVDAATPTPSPPPPELEPRSPRREGFPRLKRPSPAELYAMQRDEERNPPPRVRSRSASAKRALSPHGIRPAPTKKPKPPEPKEDSKDLFETHWTNVDSSTLGEDFSSHRNRSRSASVQRKKGINAKIPPQMRPGASDRARSKYLKKIKSVAELETIEKNLRDAYTMDLAPSDRKSELHGQIAPLFGAINTAKNRLKRLASHKSSASRLSGLKPTKGAKPKRSRSKELSESMERQVKRQMKVSKEVKKRLADEERERWVRGRATPAPRLRTGLQGKPPKTASGFGEWRKYANKY